MGLELALGRAVDVAINHDPEAVSMHRANHPGTHHLCQDVFAARPLDVTRGRPVGLAWFSPDCTYFSKARGAKPIRDVRRRDLAWVVVRWAKAVRPRVILLENVEEFRTWGPLVDGRPCPRRRGSTFGRWRRELERAGYVVEWRELRACDFGAPTVRKRLFVIARCDGAPIVWPEPTHGPGRPLPFRTAAECIDWSLPVPSIFDRARPLADNTLRRIARGVRRFVLEAGEPFVVNNLTGAAPRSCERPMATVLTGDHKYLVEPFGLTIRGTSPAHIDASPHTLGGPVRTLTTSAHQALVAPFGVPRHGERPTQEPRCLSMDRPLPTITGTANGASLVGAFLAKHFGGVVGQSLDRPASTVTAKDHHALVTAQLERGAHGRAIVALLERFAPGPLRLDSDGRVLVRAAGQDHALTDLGMRMLAPAELFRCQGFPEGYQITHGSDEFGQPVRLTQTSQVRLCGNSVCPPVVEALVRANAPNLCVAQGGAA
ncbi:MAG: DNA cytosine methyltransferase [Planctomycetaceae bacterium]|nr:DNA cytosine methyltransferase [Planctomycetaceae bacterium]